MIERTAARVAFGWVRWRQQPRARRFLLGAIALAWTAFGVAWWRLLPDPLFATPRSYVLEARDGTLLSARIASDGQWRFPAAEHVPLKFKRALLAYEDKRFESHLGVDPLAVARAARLNINRGKVVSGGSTLTMQLARLAANEPGRSVREKLGEMLLAQRLELRYGRKNCWRCTRRTRRSAATWWAWRRRRGATSGAGRRS
jgi:penicillin-binding protein 1C